MLHELVRSCNSIAGGCAQLLKMSCTSEEGVMEVRNTSCDILLKQRVNTKTRSKRMSDVLNKLHVAEPKPRDSKSRPPVIPQSVVARKQLVSLFIYIF